MANGETIGERIARGYAGVQSRAEAGPGLGGYGPLGEAVTAFQQREPGQRVPDPSFPASFPMDPFANVQAGVSPEGLGVMPPVIPPGASGLLRPEIPMDIVSQLGGLQGVDPNFELARGPIGDPGFGEGRELDPYFGLFPEDLEGKTGAASGDDEDDPYNLALGEFTYLPTPDATDMFNIARQGGDLTGFIGAYSPMQQQLSTRRSQLEGAFGEDERGVRGALQQELDSLIQESGQYGLSPEKQDRLEVLQNQSMLALAEIGTIKEQEKDIEEEIDYAKEIRKLEMAQQYALAQGDQEAAAALERAKLTDDGSTRRKMIGEFFAGQRQTQRLSSERLAAREERAARRRERETEQKQIAALAGGLLPELDLSGLQGGISPQVLQMLIALAGQRFTQQQQAPALSPTIRSV